MVVMVFGTLSLKIIKKLWILRHFVPATFSSIKAEKGEKAILQLNTSLFHKKRLKNLALI